jgi:hypothetical protein
VRRLEITKYRGSDFAPGEFPLSFGPQGMDVAAPGTAEILQDATTERVSSGFAGLDAMLGGGVYKMRDHQVTAIITSLVDGDDPQAEATELQISTIADTWIHLSYQVRGGERNRALTIVKSRGTQHSNQVRELVLSAAGPALADVYSSGGEVRSRTNGAKESRSGT